MKTFSDSVEDGIVTRWQNTSLLEGCQNKTALAFALEGQRCVNEHGNDLPMFKRISIPLLVRVFNTLDKLKGSYWPQKDWVDTGIAVEDVDPKDASFDLQKEADKTADLARQLTEWFSKRLDEGTMTTVCCLQSRGGKIFANIG